MKQITALAKAFPRLFLIAIAVMQIALCVSCSNPDSFTPQGRQTVLSLLDRAETLLGTDDSTALAILDSIDPRLIRPHRQQALYALLQSEALYKNYITASSDSLIMTAVRYYSSTNDAEHQFRAFYMLGCIYNELGQTTDAAVALCQAEQLAGKITDDYRLGLLNTAIGNIFFDSFDFNRAVQYYRQAHDHYQAAGKERHAMHARYDIGRCLLETNDELMAHDIFYEVQGLSHAAFDWGLLYSSLCSQLSASLILNELVWASAEADTLIKLYGVPETDPFAMSLLARLNIMQGQNEEAFRNIEIGWQSSETPSDSVKLFLCESLLSEMGGDWQKALQKYRQSIYFQHRNLYQLQNKPALGALKDYYREVAQVESLKVSQRKGMMVFLSISFVLIVIALIAVMKYQRLKSDAALSELNWIIDDFRLKENTNNSRLNKLNVQINNLFKGTYSKLDRILAELTESECIFQEYGISQSGNKSQVAVFKKVKSAIEELASSEYQEHLNNLINSTYNDIMKRLADIGMKERDLLLFRLLVAGLSPKSASYILHIPVKTLYQSRSRILNKMAETNPLLYEELRNILNISK